MLSRSKAVFAAVSFSKVTVALLVAVASLEVGFTEISLIFPQKLKKSRTSFSVVWEEIPSTWTVVDMIVIGVWESKFEMKVSRMKRRQRI